MKYVQVFIIPARSFREEKSKRGVYRLAPYIKVTTCSKVLNFVHKIFLGIKEEPLLCGVNTK